MSKALYFRHLYNPEWFFLSSQIIFLHLSSCHLFIFLPFLFLTSTITDSLPLSLHSLHSLAINIPQIFWLHHTQALSLALPLSPLVYMMSYFLAAYFLTSADFTSAALIRKKNLNWSIFNSRAVSSWTRWESFGSRNDVFWASVCWHFGKVAILFFSCSVSALSNCWAY